MNNKVFDFLKWLALIAIPALATFVGVVGPELDVDNPERYVLILTASGTFLGALLGISNVQYNKKELDNYQLEADEEEVE